MVEISDIGSKTHHEYAKLEKKYIRRAVRWGMALGFCACLTVVSAITTFYYGTRYVAAQSQTKEKDDAGKRAAYAGTAVLASLTTLAAVSSKIQRLERSREDMYRQMGQQLME